MSKESNSGVLTGIVRTAMESIWNGMDLFARSDKFDN